MADVDEGSKAESGEWEWVPSRRYGPFVFGTPIASVPFVGQETDRTDMGDHDVSTSYDSDPAGYSMAFWNGLLNGVECYESFILQGREFVGAQFNEVKGLFSLLPVVKNYDPILMVEYDELDLVLFLDMDWAITSVYVASDPDNLQPLS